MIVHYKMFKSSTKTWSTLFHEASEFAAKVGEQRLINISHNCDNGTAVVTVWFWDKPKSTGMGYGIS